MILVFVQAPVLGDSRFGRQVYTTGVPASFRFLGLRAFLVLLTFCVCNAMKHARTMASTILLYKAPGAKLHWF